MAEQVATIFAGTNGYIDNIPVDQVRSYFVGLRQFIVNTEYSKIIEETKILDEEATQSLKQCLENFSKQFVPKGTPKE